MKKKLKYIALSILAVLALVAVYFFSVRYLDEKVLTSLDVPENAVPAGGDRILLATYFLDGERFYFKLPTMGKDTLMAFGDTGGGISFLLPRDGMSDDIASKLRRAILKGIMPVKYILFEEVVGDPDFPKPNPSRRLILRTPFNRVTKPYLLVPPMDEELKLIMDVQSEMDVFLGQTFFMNYSWTFDYPKQQIWVNTPLHDSLVGHPNTQKVGFKKNENGIKINGHPSMTIEIDGDTIDVLFDTGASMILSSDGKEQFQTDKKTLGGSFIAASIYKKWRKDHPDWKYYPNADLVGDIIEVPSVKIGEFEVGPVLFAVRRDEAWSEGMIASMDKVVKGAIGGSVLKYFKVTIDYNSELIQFER